MTITSNITPTITYNGNGSTTAFAIPFLFFTSSDIVVVLTSSLGVDSTLVFTTDYTVSGGGTYTPATGTVTLLVAPANGESLTIYREIEKSQATDYILYNTFPADLHEKALDKLTLITQDLAEEVGRAAKVGRTSGLASLTLPDPSASKILAWNSPGTALENVDMATAILNINSLDSETSIDGAADYIPIYDASEGANNKVLPVNLPVGISNLTSLASVDSAADYTIVYDASAGVNKKVLVQDIPQTGGNAPVSATYVTLTTDATLTNERTLGASTAIALTDNGAGNSVDISVNVNAPAEETSPALVDFVLGYDVSATATKKFKVTNIPIPPINTLTTDSSPDTTADFVLTYDTSASANKKVLMDDLLNSSAMVKLSTTTISAPTAQIDFTGLTSTYQVYVLEYFGVTNGSSASIQAQVSIDNGATFISSANSYGYYNISAGSGTRHTSMIIGTTAASYQSFGRVSIQGPTSATAYTAFEVLAGYVITSASGADSSRVGARLNAEVNNAFRVSVSAGSMTAGTFILYGIK